MSRKKPEVSFTKFISEYVTDLIAGSLALRKESDRAMVLIGCELLTDALELLLRVKFHTCGLTHSDAKDLVKTGVAPYSSMWARTMACRSFGVLPHDICDALDAYREARNLCAHGKAKVSLQDTDAAKWVHKVRQFLGSEIEPSSTARVVMEVGAVELSRRIVTRADQIIDLWHESTQQDTPPGDPPK